MNPGFLACEARYTSGMRIGIDFGTSYSAAAACIEGELRPVRFGEAQQFRTAVYFPEHMPDGDSVRRHREGSVATAGRLAEALFGEEAIEAYLLEGDGHLVESPKSMLGYQLHPRAKDTIAAICARILGHIREQASAQFGVEVREAVLGRPVHFRSSMGEAGEVQALALLRTAAAVAGFRPWSFLKSLWLPRLSTMPQARGAMRPWCSTLAAAPPTLPGASWAAPRRRACWAAGAWVWAAPILT